MRSVVNSERASQSVGSSKRQLLLSSVLWIIQGGLALLFLLAGGEKLVLPIGIITAQMPLPLAGSFLRFIGAAEVVGALGLILPGFLRMRPILIPLAACGLLLDMIGATVVTLLGGKGMAALFPLLVGLLCATIAYGRRS